MAKRIKLPFSFGGNGWSVDFEVEVVPRRGRSARRSGPGKRPANVPKGLDPYWVGKGKRGERWSDE